MDAPRNSTIIEAVQDMRQALLDNAACVNPNQIKRSLNEQQQLRASCGSPPGGQYALNPISQL
jgi:hypothetical protein